MLAALAVVWLLWRVARRAIAVVLVLGVLGLAGAYALNGRAPSLSAPSLGQLEHHLPVLTPQDLERLLRRLGLHPAPLPPLSRCHTPGALPAPLCAPPPRRGGTVMSDPGQVCTEVCTGVCTCGAHPGPPDRLARAKKRPSRCLTTPPLRVEVVKQHRGRWHIQPIGGAGNNSPVRVQQGPAAEHQQQQKREQNRGEGVGRFSAGTLSGALPLTVRAGRES